MKSKASPNSSLDRRALTFILITGFLNFAGIGLIGPVTKFIVERYVRDPAEVAIATGLLFTSYSFFQFLAVPALGALSDRYGRRPVLLISLLGSAVGYVLFGIGGALWVLFLGRIIDGVTGGNIGTIFAYIADLTEPQERTRYFGLLGAVFGLGFAVGPAVGGALAAVGGETAPVFFAALVSLLNVVWGYFVMPESLKPENRSDDIRLAQLNPFSQLAESFHIPQLRWLLIATFMWMLPFAALQANLPVLGSDFLGSREQDVGAIFTIVGVVGIIVQGGLIRPLQERFGEKQLTLGGAVIFAIGFALLALIPTVRSNVLLVAGTIVFSVGNGLVTPALAGLISETVSAREQGRVQGGSQSMQALGRVIGPAIGGFAYGRISAAFPYWAGALLLMLAAVCVLIAVPGWQGTPSARAVS